MEKISERVRHVIEEKVESKGRPTTLEEITGVAAETWRKFLAGKQRATLAMVETVARNWPEYAFWITTGITDSAYGHICHEKQYDKKVNRKRYERSAAKLYFLIKLEMIEGNETKIKKEQIEELYEGASVTIPFERTEWSDKEEQNLYENSPEIEKRRFDIETMREWEQLELMNAEFKSKIRKF